LKLPEFLNAFLLACGLGLFKNSWFEVFFPIRA